MSKGKAFLLKISNGAEPAVYLTVGGFRMVSEAISLGLVSIVGSGIMLGSAAEQQVRNLVLSGTVDDFEFSFEDGAKMRGRFLIKSLENAGHFGGEQNYKVALESAGNVELMP